MVEWEWNGHAETSRARKSAEEGTCFFRMMMVVAVVMTVKVMVKRTGATVRLNSPIKGRSMV